MTQFTKNEFVHDLSNQELLESLPIPGSRARLVYRSSGAAGAHATIDIRDGGGIALLLHFDRERFFSQFRFKKVSMDFGEVEML